MKNTLLIGLDAASDHRKFGYAIGQWSEAGLTIDASGCLAGRQAKSGEALQRIAEQIVRAGADTRVLIAIDAPLGWPEPLADSLAVHKAGQPLHAKKDALFNRTTDLRLKALGHRPLEIGADRIARAAVEALVVLEELRSTTGLNIPLAWKPEFEGQAAIEVYPAATLKARGLPHTKYKNPKDPDSLSKLAKHLAKQFQNLEKHVQGNVDAFDAALCLLCASDFLHGYCSAPAEQAKALKEGWTWVKDDHAPDHRTDTEKSAR